MGDVSSQPEPILDLARVASWTDPDGTTWTRRGTLSSQVSRSRRRRLLADEEAVVVQCFLGTVTVIPLAHRQASWRAAVELDRAQPQTDLTVVEFVGPERQRLLVLQEYC